jgi:hypothetical protein
MSFELKYGSAFPRTHRCLAGQVQEAMKLACVLSVQMLNVWNV